jgi:hypothetical protein
MQPTKTNTTGWTLLIGLAAILVVGLAIASVAGRKPLNDSPVQITPNQVAPTVVGQILQGTPVPLSVASPNLSSDQQTQSAQATQNALGTQSAIATDSAFKQIVATTAQYLNTIQITPMLLPGGIVEGPNGDLPSLIYLIQNRWYGSANGNGIVVYAGALADDLSQGIVHIALALPDWLFEQDYLTPIKVGSIHIAAEQNARLTLVATDNTVFYFDVPGLQYVDSLTEIVPTFTLPTTTQITVAQATANFLATDNAYKQQIGATAQAYLTDHPVHQEPAPTGIQDNGGGDFPVESDFDIQNMWRGADGIRVYAGRLRSDPTQGLVIVAGRGVIAQYPTSIKAGSLRIIDERNLRLTLLSTHGATFYFDVPGEQFVSSLSEVVPTVTPLPKDMPTATPIPTPNRSEGSGVTNSSHDFATALRCQFVG